MNLYCAAKLGLENITALHQALGSPLQRIPNIVHVGGACVRDAGWDHARPLIYPTLCPPFFAPARPTGTNGKGSVAYKVAKALQHSGVRTGLFVSPHVASFRERMQVDGQLISEAEVVSLLEEVLRVREEQRIPATFFEVTTGLAFQFFAQRQLGAAVIEVGLGGRLDATNILTPRLSVITSIGLEHTRILGTTVEAIAREKAGIIKPGVPVVLGPKVPHELLGGIAAERGAPVLRVPLRPYKSFEEENTAIASTALNHLRTSLPSLPLTEAAVAHGLASRPPCRFERLEREVALPAAGGGRLKVQVPVVLDVGHNPPALRRLFERLAAEPAGRNGKPRRLRVLLGLSADKDIGVCVKTVLEFVPPELLHVIQALHPRAAQPQLLVEAAAALGAPLPPANYGYASIQEGVEAALAQSAAASEQGEDETVVVCGSFFVMGDVRQALGFEEPQDSAVIAEVAGAQFAAAQELFSEAAGEAAGAGAEAGGGSSSKAVGAA